MAMTITEALAEIKLVTSKIDKKKQFVLNNIGRQDGIKDPFEKDGGTNKLVSGEMQAITDLTERLVQLRTEIAAANAKTLLEVNGVSRSVANWLVWRREAAPIIKVFYDQLTRGVAGVRDNARTKGLAVVTSGQPATTAADVIIEIDEMKLSKNVEMIQEILDRLDGKLSLHNAITTVEV